jgi:hypothetical protein
MSPASTTASSFTLTLTDDERAQLLSFLEQAIRDKHVEAHRTEASDFRKHVEHQEAIMQGLIDRLRRR